VEYYDGVVNPTSSNEANMWLKLVASTNKYVAMRYLSAHVLEASPPGIITENRALNASEMQTNAQYIKNYLCARGWTKQAACGVLGNLESESTINPGRHQTNGVGFGLCQWDPPTKITYWAPAHGYTVDSIDGQLERLIVEGKGVTAPEKEWLPSSDYSTTYAQFIVSTSSAGVLARIFCLNYERPASTSTNTPAKENTLNDRATKANAWFNLLT
jgi:hypothetical protein